MMGDDALRSQTSGTLLSATRQTAAVNIPEQSEALTSGQPFIKMHALELFSAGLVARSCY